MPDAELQVYTLVYPISNSRDLYELARLRFKIVYLAPRVPSGRYGPYYEPAGVAPTWRGIQSPTPQYLVMGTSHTVENTR
jgi:hypothetical protein